MLSRLLNTLKGYVFSATVGVAFFAFVGAAFTSVLLYEHLLQRQNLQVAKEIAAQNLRAIHDVMRRGGSHRKIEEVMAQSQAAFPNTIESIEVHRSDKVEVLYGAPHREPLPNDVRESIENAREVVTTSGGSLEYTYPIVAQRECQACHNNATAGDVLGAIKLRHKVQVVEPRLRLYYIAVFLMLGFLVFLAAIGFTMFAAGRINTSAQAFLSKVESVRTVKDLEQVDFSRIAFGFAEFDQAFDHVALLVDRIRKVAVDKSVLEFEIRLLEKFIITSNVVRDWREFIKKLLLDINPIVEAYALVTLFRIEEESYECEVFWRNRPPGASVAAFETFLRQQLLKYPQFHAEALLHIMHHVADETAALPELGIHEIELQTKTLLLETPRIGGIVGIGVQSTLAQDNIRNMVIGSILTTLLNLVGSVKAIHKYTKDLEHYATRDPLTDLYNQRMFWELLGYEVGRAKRHQQSFAVVMIDLDNFKTINDRYGHHLGDAYLEAFSKLLRKAVRDGDLLARYGGDEFCIILPEAGDVQAHSVAQRIVESLDGFSIEAPDGNKVKATTSAGIAIYPAHGDNPKDLFLVADNMMYKAKNSGKNAIAIPSEDEMAEVFRKAGEKAIMIQNALDRQTLLPYFQPIRDVRSGRVLIHELLMRIQLGDEIVAANEFIEEAESMGIAHKMDYQLIEKAFAQIKRQGYEGMLFVNLSPKALIVGEFAQRVGQLAGQHGIAPQRIVFEITERETVKNISLLEKFVVSVKMQGFSFAIDDFGSGYSSFQYIKRFPVDYLKIEGEFIRNMLSDEVYLAFVKSIVTLAQELKIKTVAEFVEDDEIMEAVRTLGIDFAQGYQIGRPAPDLYY